ncbi:MAG: T9SS type A sorting domain-containing protein [Flavobacteriales bacterium]|nr:T9SS type A sorting domain-containing protein [Flavobacteriales bacterium]
MEGSAAQEIKGTTASTFYKLAINNTSATGVTLLKPGTVTSVLTLTDGNLYSDATNLITLNDGAVVNNGTAAQAGSATTFVDGPMKKIGDDAFTFPTGDGTTWARIGMTDPGTDPAQVYTAEYFAVNPNGLYSVSSLGPILSVDGNVSQVEYWTLDQAGAIDDVQVKLFWENDVTSGIDLCDATDLRVAHWDGAQWEVNVDGANITGSCAQTPNVGAVETNAVQPDYSPFTFSSKVSTNNPLASVLPIELLYFNAKHSAERNEVDLTWVTSSETNNEFFTVEKSKNGIEDFEKVLTTPGAGTSNQVRYYYEVDDNPEYGITYYRLKQTDYDGKFEYSDLSVVQILRPLEFSVRPNPARDYLEVRFGHVTMNSIAVLTPEYEAELGIYDLTGRLVYSKTFEGTFYKFNIDISALDGGMYITYLVANGASYSAKFIKE